MAIKATTKDSSDGWIMNAEYLTIVDPEQQDYALSFSATWLVRAVHKQMGDEANTSHTSAITENPALTSEPVNCTVGAPSSCKTGGSNK